MDPLPPKKKIHRFIGGFSVDGREATVTDPALAHQMRDVLKLATGETVALVDERGEHLSRITALGPAAVKAEILETAAAAPEPPVRVVLYCSIIKKENFELIVQKATEIGVGEIVPIVARRTVKLNVRGDRLTKIAKEAAEQSGRTTLPAISGPVGLEQAMDKAASSGWTVFFDVSGAPTDRLAKPGKEKKQLNIFIGPEGGWDEAEVAAARKRGFDIVSLGGLILKAETAAIVASHLACHAGG